MANPQQIRRRNSGAAGAPSSLLTAELAWNNQDKKLYLGAGDNGSGVATSIETLLDVAAAATTTPTATSGSGTITTVVTSLVTKLIPKNTVLIGGQCGITNAGTGVGALYIPLPYANMAQNLAISAFNAVTGEILIAFIASGESRITIYKPAFVTAIATGAAIYFGGSYQKA